MTADVTLATSDVWATAIGERHDVVIVGPLGDEITEAYGSDFRHIPTGMSERHVSAGRPTIM